jgi:hypothetical protein
MTDTIRSAGKRLGQKPSSKEFLDKYGSLWTVLVLALVVLVFGLLSSTLFTQAGWEAVSKSTYEYLPLAIGETFVILTGGIDLSVGAVLGFSCVVSGTVMEHMLGTSTGSLGITVLGFVVGIAVGGLCGFLNGILITRLRLPPFIVTLATLYALGGATYIVSEEPIYQIPHQLVTFGQQSLFGGWFIAPVLVALACVVVFGVFLSRFRFGLRTYAIGSNRGRACRHQRPAPPRLGLRSRRRSSGLGGHARLGELRPNLAVVRQQRRARRDRCRRYRWRQSLRWPRQPARHTVRDVSHRRAHRRARARPSHRILAGSDNRCRHRLGGVSRSAPAERVPTLRKLGTRGTVQILHQ